MDAFLYEKLGWLFGFFDGDLKKKRSSQRVLQWSLNQNGKYMNELESLNYKTGHLVDIVSLVC